MDPVKAFEMANSDSDSSVELLYVAPGYRTPPQLPRAETTTEAFLWLKETHPKFSPTQLQRVINQALPLVLRGPILVSRIGGCVAHLEMTQEDAYRIRRFCTSRLCIQHEWCEVTFEVYRRVE